MVYLLSFLLLIQVISGCAEITPPSPEKMLPPWGSTPLVRLGESKDSVRNKWGEPDEVRQLGADDVGLVKEEWIYRGRYSALPIDEQYLSRTKRLIFTGDSLTTYEKGDAVSPTKNSTPH